MNEQLGITGKWTHKLTGVSINVRDSIIDGDKMIIISDKGQIDMEYFSQYYIQTSDEIYNEQGQVIDNKPVDISEVYNNNQETYYPVVNNDIKTNDFNNEILNTNNVIKQESTPIIESKPITNNFDLIDKLFKKRNYQPVIKIDIQSSDFPLNELKMLMDIYDVGSADIANYLLKEYINQDTICNSVLNYVEKKLIKFSE
jgi:hypothetical protein